MSSPCLLRAAPISQPRLREVKISLKASSRETTAIRSSGGGTKEAASRTYALAEKEAPVRVGMSSSRSKSTPAVHRAQRPESRKSARGSSSSSSSSGSGKQQGPEHHPERNGTVLHIPLTVAPAGLSPFSSSSSSSSSCTPRRQRPSHPHPPPALLSSSSSSSAKSMKRARWLSYSTSNICFNSILDGRFRQLQGNRGPDGRELRVFVHLRCVGGGEFVNPSHRPASSASQMREITLFQSRPSLSLNLCLCSGRDGSAGRLGCDVSKCEVSLSSRCESWEKKKKKSELLKPRPFFSFFIKTYMVVIYLFSGSCGCAPIVH